MRIEENTFSLNIRILGTNDTDARAQVEGLDPMTREELWSFLIRACKAGELPKSARPSREVWRDTREHPMPKAKLKAMDEYNKVYKMFKRKFPLADEALLKAKTKQYIEQRKNILADFQAAMAGHLEEQAQRGKSLQEFVELFTKSKQASSTPNTKTLEEIASADEAISELLA